MTDTNVTFLFILIETIFLLKIKGSIKIEEHFKRDPLSLKLFLHF